MIRQTGGPWYNSLTVQIVLLMTLVLLPLGAISIYQTNRVAAEAENNSRLALLAVTGRAAKAEELLIEQAFGSARFFANVAVDFVENPARCARDLGQFVNRNAQYSFIGLLPVTGKMTCSSSGETFDFSGWPGFADIMASQQRRITVNADAPLSKQSVFIISEPYEIHGVFAGFVSVSVPHSGLPDRPEELAELGLEALMTFSTDGTVLTARTGIEKVAYELPMTQELQELVTDRTHAFSGRNKDGDRRIYTIVPIEGSPATVMGVWRVSDGLAGESGVSVGPSLFPALMWLASMGIALIAIYMLVLRHVTGLQAAMERFADDRHQLQSGESSVMPNELRALNVNFSRMTDDILRDEAVLEKAVAEKEVLIKEIHHRVKNNLQLISSIMNMQIRSAESEETRNIIASLQDRVRSLAMIHRDLYQSENEGMVDAGGLVTEILEKSFDMAVSRDGAVDLDTDVDRVLLYPDQAVPLSLLVAEAVTNTLKYVGAEAGEKLWVRASLKQSGKDCALTLSNSVGDVVKSESTGVGADLIKAFATQLGGTLSVEALERSYTMKVDFTVSDFVPEVRAY